MLIQSKSVKAALVLGASIFAARASQAAVLYSTGFNAPTYVDGALNPSTDTTTPGQDGWLGTSSTVNLISVSNTATNGIVTMTNNGNDVRHLLSGAVSSGSAYLDADFTCSAANATGDYFIHLGDGSTTIFNARTHIKSSGAGFVMGVGTGAGTPNYGATVLNFGTQYHLLVRYDFVAGAANDTGALYINPTTADGSGDVPYVAMTTVGIDAASISAVYLRQGTAANAPSLSLVDNIAVNGVVPEPASLGLLGLGGLMLGRRRRA